MNELHVWIRVAGGLVSVLGALGGLVLWMWRMLQKQARENTAAIRDLEKAFAVRFDELETEITHMKQNVSHQASDKDIASITARLSAIEANQKSMNTILTLIHQHILSAAGIERVLPE